MKAAVQRALLLLAANSARAALDESLPDDERARHYITARSASAAAFRAKDPEDRELHGIIELAEHLGVIAPAS